MKNIHGILLSDIVVGATVITKDYVSVYDGKPLKIKRISGPYCYFNDKSENFSKDMVVKINKLYQIY